MVPGRPSLRTQPSPVRGLSADEVRRLLAVVPDTLAGRRGQAKTDARTPVAWSYQAYGDGRICEWHRADLEDLLLSHFPRKVTLPDDELLAVAPEIGYALDDPP